MREIPEELQAELAALADGTLEAASSERLRARVERSPALAAALQHQQRALAAMRVAESAVAPASLREAVQRLGAEAAARDRDGSIADANPAVTGAEPAADPDAHPPRRILWRPSRSGRPLASAGACALAAVAIVLAVVFTGASGPTIAGAVALTQRHATKPARVQPASAYRIAASVDGVHFPRWARQFGWRATGERVAHVGGRPATAVYYAKADRHLGYAILAGAPLLASGGRTVSRGGVRYRLLTVDHVPAITWQRDGHTCVIAGHGVSSATLIALASRRI